MENLTCKASVDSDWPVAWSCEGYSPVESQPGWQWLVIRTAAVNPCRSDYGVLGDVACWVPRWKLIQGVDSEIDIG